MITKVEPKWYVIRTANGKEKQVKETIQVELDGRNLENTKLLVANEKVYETRNGKKYLREKNFYPGYLFVKTNIIGEIGDIIKNVKYSYGFLGSGRPEALRDSEIQKMLGKVDEVAEETNMSYEFIVGESVNIVDGPFSSFIGEVEEIDGKKQRLKLNVKIFGRKTPLELTFEQVQKVY